MSALNHFDEVLKQKLENRKKIKETNAEHRQEEEKKVQEFNERFEALYDSLLHSAKELNEELSPAHLKLDVVRNVDFETANRKAIQVVLSEEDKKINLLEDPYLLIEGYANEGQVRIVKGGATDTGEIKDVNNISEEVLQSKLSNFLCEVI